MKPVRTCLGCRSREFQSTLLRVVERDGEVIPDPSGSAHGRGAWVHPTSECIDAAIKRKAFGRALRSVVPLDTARVRALAGESTDPLEEQAD
jgi:predicted RNA-binding protein YlxR (DUF448 family)